MNAVLLKINPQHHQEDKSVNHNDKWVTGLDLFNMKVEAIPMLVGDLIPQIGLVALVGSSDAGKSMFLRQLSIALVRDDTFLNLKLFPKYRKVAFVSSEDEARNIAFLIFRQSEGNNNGLENLFFFCDSESILLELDKKLINEPVDLIVVDAWGDVFSGNQVDSGQIRQTLNEYKRISVKFNCAIIFLNHTGKRTQKLSPSKDNILGGQGFEAKMRLVLELRSDNENEDYKHLCVVKGNYLGKEFKEYSYKLKFDAYSFLFYDTGERVSLESLAQLPQEDYRQKKTALILKDISEITHKEILLSLFKANGWQMKDGNLKPGLSRVYKEKYENINRIPSAVDLLNYVFNEAKLLSKVGKANSPKSYYELSFISNNSNFNSS